MSHPSSPVPCILPSNQAAPASSQVSKAIKNITSNPIQIIMSKSIAPIAQAIAPIATIAVIYVVDEQGVLYSAKPKEFVDVQKNVKLLKAIATLKHNPTNVFGTGTARRSTEDRRPLYLLEKGKFFKQATIAEPAKVTKTNSAGKQVKQTVSGPATIYIVGDLADTRPYSVNPEQFANLQKDLAGLKFLPKLKHLPTCVEISLTRGIISTEEDRRPLYRVTKGKLVQHWSTETLEKAASKPVVEKVAKERPLTKKEQAAKKAASLASKESTPAVDQAIVSETSEAVVA